MINPITKFMTRFGLLFCAIAALSITGFAQQRNAPRATGNGTISPPFNQCPAVGLNTSCAILIVVNADNSISILADPNMGPYDGSDDTLVGFQNNSSTTRFSLPLSSSQTDIFGFEGDGLCGGFSPAPAGCPFGPTGYEGPGVTFSNINGNATSGVVNFTNGVAPGGHAYFSLEETLTATSFTVPVNTTCPAGAALGTFFSTQLVASGGAGAPYTWSLTGGSLGNLSLSPTGVVSGTQTTGGTLTFTITVTDSKGGSSNQPCSMTIQPPALNVFCVFAPATLSAPGSTTAPATITVLTGATVSASCGVTGGTAQYNWTYTNRPAWLIPSGTTGTNISLSGVAPPPPPGTYTVTVSVTDSTSPTPLTGSTTITIIVLPPLMITCNPQNASVAPGSQLSVVCGATGGVAPFTWSYAGLPSFLQASGTTGSSISLNGIVPNPPPSSYSFTVLLHDNMSGQVQQTITVTVGKGGGSPGPLLFLTCTPSSATVNPGTQFTASCAVSGGTPPYFISPAGAPAWLAATVTATGVTFSGTVPSPPPTSYSVGVSVADAGSPARNQSASIAITVNGGKLSLTCPGTVSVAAGSPFNVGCSVTGGTGPFSWSYSGFPGGASGPASGSSVTVSGTMPAPPPSSYTGSVTVTDSSSPSKQSASQTVSLTNTTPLFSVSCNGPTSVAAGGAYSATCSALGGTPGYNWTFSLPQWVTASGNTGPIITLSGTMPSPPPASYTITASATDSTLPTAQSGSQTFTVSNTTPVLSISCTPGPATVAIGAAYSTTCSASGGTSGYMWSYSGLPSWLTGGTSGPSITLSGTAIAPAGTVSVVVTLTDSGVPTKQTQTQTITFRVTPPALVVTCSALTGSISSGIPYTSSCSATGGTQPYNWSGTLPSWLGFSATTGATITLSGTPPNPPPASYSFSVTATDSTAPTPLSQSQSYALTVVPLVPTGTTVSTNVTGVSANMANVVINLGAPATTAFSTTVQLTFKPDPSVTNLPSSYNGIGTVCESGTGFPAGALVTGSCFGTATVNIPVGSSTATTAFSVGTVAGTWTATLVSANGSPVPAPAPTGTFVVQPGAPTILNEGGSAAPVKILNANSSGFDVKITGVSPTRELSSASFTFSGTGLTGTSFTVPLNGPDQQYFNSPTGFSGGGTFTFTIHFNYSGDPTAISSVSVTVTNSKGTSPAVSGGQ